MRFVKILVGVLVLLSFAVALAPEPAAKPIHDLQVRVLRGTPNQFALADIMDRDASVHAAIKADRNFTMMRSWSAEGLKPLELEIGPIPAVRFLGVTYQGAVRDRDGLNGLYLRCSSRQATLPISTGGAQTALLEVITPLGRDWCPDGQIFLRMTAASPTENLGVSQPYEVSAAAFLKRSYIGYLAYFAIAFALASAIFFLGGVAARGTRSGVDPTLAGLLAVGASSLLAFYLYAWTPFPAPLGLAPAAALLLAPLFIIWRHRRLALSVWRGQRGPLTAWFFVAFSVFTVLHIGATGSGTWEPNYRYAPATWSSDHTLALFFAEAARIGSIAGEGHLGPWSLSDRPPLLAGGYLLLGDTYAALQTGNDGLYLQPIVLGMGGIVFCALWAAAFYWGARRIGRLEAQVAALGTVLVAVTPFALFNTGYTWPKLLAAAFSLMAAAYAFRPRAGQLMSGETALFGALAGFALLSHAASAFFLLPVSIIYLVRRLWRSPKAAIVGAAVGLALLGTWAGFKATVLPSSDPLLRFALTGELRFDQTDQSVPEVVAARYGRAPPGTWIKTKVESATYLFTPFPKPSPDMLARPPSTPDAKSDGVGKLRNWDFFSLTLGNSAVLVLGAIAAWRVWRSRSLGDARLGLSYTLLLAAVCCYAIFVLATFLPLVVHQFSYDAILAMALAGVIALDAGTRHQVTLAGLTLVTALYCGLVWVVAPLRQLVSLDLVAVAVASGLSGLMVWSSLRALRQPAPGATAPLAAGPQARSPRELAGALGLGAILAAILLLQPVWLTLLVTAPQRQLSPIHAAASAVPALPAPNTSRCVGSLDGRAPGTAGALQAYGWAWDVKAAAPVVAVRLVDPTGRTVATAEVGIARPDVPTALPQVTSPLVGWSVSSAPRQADVTIMATLANESDCALSGAIPW